MLLPIWENRHPLVTRVPGLLSSRSMGIFDFVLPRTGWWMGNPFAEIWIVGLCCLLPLHDRGEIVCSVYLLSCSDSWGDRRLRRLCCGICNSPTVSLPRCRGSGIRLPLLIYIELAGNIVDDHHTYCFVLYQWREVEHTLQTTCSLSRLTCSCVTTGDHRSWMVWLCRWAPIQLRRCLLWSIQMAGPGEKGSRAYVFWSCPPA